jgi:hypothetical protein
VRFLEELGEILVRPVGHLKVVQHRNGYISLECLVVEILPSEPSQKKPGDPLASIDDVCTYDESDRGMTSGWGDHIFVDLPSQRKPAEKSEHLTFHLTPFGRLGKNLSLHELLNRTKRPVLVSLHPLDLLRGLVANRRLLAGGGDIRDG